MNGVKSFITKKFELKANGQCPRCECFVDVNSFRNEISKREFRLSGYCQECQDIVFGVD